MFAQAGKAAATAVGGVVIGWCASSLTLMGRVDALEQSFLRLEAKVDRIVLRPGSTKAPPQVAAELATTAARE
jgi:hypothetical protein